MIKLLGIIIQAQANTNEKLIETAMKVNDALWMAGLTLRHNTVDKKVADVIQFPVEEAKTRHPSHLHLVD